MYYVLWDESQQRVISGPQTNKVDEKWVEYIHCEKESESDELYDVWDDEKECVVQKARENTQWLYRRCDEYPAFSAQLEAIYDDIKNGTLDQAGSFYNMIKDVKDKYPK